MKVKLDRELLADKLKKSFKFIPSKSIVPAQDNVRCTIKDNIMEIVAADSQCQVKLFMPVKSDSDGAFCLPAQLFLKTVNLFRENEVLITKKSDTVIELKNGKSKCKITMDCMPEDFPTMPEAKTTHELSISQYNLKTGIKFTEKFVDDERSVKVGAAGININEVNSRMVFTGLDGHLLCRVNVAPLAIGSWDKNIVMPVDTATKLLSLLGDNGEVTMCHSDDKMVFFTDDSIERFEITSTSVNTKFPNSEMLFSKKGEDFMIINTLELKDAFARLRLYSGDFDSDKRVHIATNGTNLNELILNSSDNLKGKDGEETMTIVNPSGKQLKKQFNSGSMLKVLANVEDNEILFYFNESDKVPCFIEPKVDGKENNFNFLIGTTS